jgi:monovalent cation:proton antiporter-2 (CPA2) family protein
MDTHGFLVGAMVVLGAAVISVPLSKRAGLGSVLGYLIAGALIGPYGLALIDGADRMRAFSELGVVLLMFIVGLELLPRRLWEMRKPVFGWGGAQVLGTGALLAVACLAYGLPPAAAVIAGLGLALSSTAFALQVLAERKQLGTSHGKNAFSILLMQDLAVIPMLALVGALGTHEATSSEASGVWVALKMLGVFGLIFAVGRYILRWFFKIIAETRSQEVFTAGALLVVFGVGFLVESIGMSMAFGAFVSGVLLADSDYRHELEADIEPFKGILLGLFFVAVGMSVNLGLLASQPLRVLAVVAAYLVLKSSAIYGLGRLIGQRDEPSRTMAFAIAQGGEFGFVLFAEAVRRGVMQQGTADLLTLCITLSMAATPLLFPLNDHVIARLLPKEQHPVDTSLPEQASRVVIAGFGRFGQIVARILALRGIPFTALDQDPKHIDFVKQWGNKVYFGDVSRLDLLRAAKVHEAEVFVLAIDDVEKSVACAKVVREAFPRVKIFARARNRPHAYKLIQLGLTHVERETFACSVEVGRDILNELGFPPTVSEETARIFRAHDEKMVRDAAEHADDFAKLKAIADAGRTELESLFQRDAR